MNILTFDIEEWYLDKEFFGLGNKKFYEYDKTLDKILELLDLYNHTATFFCLGKIAEEFPKVVQKIASHGHEIGSHSNNHRWINKMTMTEFREDTLSSISSIENLIGKKVRSFRAPAFSIGNENKWAIEVLVENGIENDASIFPGARDFGGFPNFTEQEPCKIQYNKSSIDEFPIPLYKVPFIGMDLAYSGGGYFRLLPLSFVKNQMEKSPYNMCYFHLGDLVTAKAPYLNKTEYSQYFKESSSYIQRILRYYKSNIGRKNAMPNFTKLMALFQFISIVNYKEHTQISKVIEV